MTKGNGLPCKKCGTSEWYKYGGCIQCDRDRTSRWRKSNPDKIKERNRRYRQKNPEKIKARDFRYRQNYPERGREIARRWAMAHPDAVNANTHRRLTRKTAAGGSYTAAEWKALIEHYGNKCLCCGRDDVKLSADHIIPVSKGGTSNIDNIQPLCISCNIRKKDKTIDYRPESGLGRWVQRKLFG